MTGYTATDFFGPEDMPEVDPENNKDAKRQIMASHVLTTLRQANGQSLQGTFMTHHATERGGICPHGSSDRYACPALARGGADDQARALALYGRRATA